MQLDRYDRSILEALQADGRMSNQELADRIGLSPSPCLRRVRALEEAGLIRGYRALLDEKQLGYEVTKSQIRMPKGPIKVVGDSPVSVSLHTDVLVDIQVSVYGESV